MAGIVFTAKALSKVPQQVEDELRKELGLTQPIEYTWEIKEGGSQRRTGEAVIDTMRGTTVELTKNIIDAISGVNIATAIGASIGGSVVIGGIEMYSKKELSLAGIISFNITQPRQAGLIVQVIRAGAALGAGTLFYMAMLNRPVGGEVTVEKDEPFSKPRISGDAITSQGLKDNGKLLKQIGGLVQPEFQSLNKLVKFELAIRPYLKIIPQGQTSLVVVQTLPVALPMAWSRPHRLNAKKFFEIVDALES